MNPATLIPMLNALARTVSGQAGSCLAGGTVIMVFAAICSRLLNRHSSQARFAVWFWGLIAIGAIPLFAVGRTLDAGSPAVRGEAAAIILPEAWALYLFLSWFLIVTVALARIVAGFLQVRGLRTRATLLSSSDLAPELRQTLLGPRPGRTVMLLLSDEIQSPMAMGLWSPAIVLPRWLPAELSTEELRQVLLHELEHLRRWDDWSNLLQKVFKAVFFFHPAVWWMERQISLEREMACDEAVLAQTGDPQAYAQCLVRLAERSFFRRSVMLAQAAVSRVGHTSRRVVRILHVGSPRTTRMGLAVAPSFAAVLIACMVSLAHMPRLVSFDGVDATATGARVVSARAPQSVVASTHSSLAVKAMGKRAARILPDSVSVQADAQERTPMKQPVAARSAIPAVEAKFDMRGSGQSRMKSKAAVSSDFVVVLVESRWEGPMVPAVWQVQLWHITLLRTNQTRAPQAPAKAI